MVFERFQDYSQWVKPRLDDALKSQLSNLLEDIALQDRLALDAALAGGKKIRGSLLCLVTHALGGVLETAIPRAVAVEFVQAASLIHDDFVDQDTVRRNQPATWTLEGARRAVLLGDVIFASAIKMMSDLGRQEGAVISHAIAQVSRGALHEPLNPPMLAREIQSNRVDERLYEKIIHLKTGILFGAACRLGAFAAGADPELRERSYRYGLRIGEAYQIADDIHEMRRYILNQPIDPVRMVLLAPACIYFAGRMTPHIPAVLDGSCAEVSENLQHYFKAAVQRMEDEIERRVAAAQAEIEAHFPRNEFSTLAQRAPRDLIRMFNES
ncbi:MAG: polyprenyl synthetase family protein [Desulfobacterales bacterium]